MSGTEHMEPDPLVAAPQADLRKNLTGTEELQLNLHQHPMSLWRPAALLLAALTLVAMMLRGDRLPLLAVLLVVWRTTRGVLGRGGMLVVLAFCLSTGMAVLGATGLALLARETLVIWLLVSIAGLFTAGLCYSHVHHRLGGISHNEQVEK